MFNNFIPTVESEGLLRELDKYLAFGNNCSREYEGTISEAGDQIKIKMAGKPTIKELTRDEIQYTGLGNPEKIENTDLLMQINQIRGFDWVVGDIDKELAKGESSLIASYRKDSGIGLANESDKYIAKVMVDGANVTTETTTTSKTNILGIFDDAVQRLNENNVPDGTELVAEVSPKAWKILKQAYVDLDTNNSVKLANRPCGVYNGIKIVKTTGCMGADGTDGTDYIFIHTKKACAFVNAICKTKAQEIQGTFSERIMGYNLFDAKVVRPRELEVIKLKWS